MTDLPRIAAATALMLGLAGQADAARLDPADFGYDVSSTVVWTGDYSVDLDPVFGFVSVEGSGTTGAIVLNGLPPFAAADFDILLAGIPVPPSPGAALLGAASIIGDDGIFGFDLLFDSLAGQGGVALPAGSAIFASVVYDTALDDPDLPGLSFGSATTSVSLLVPQAVIPLPASGLLLLGAAGGAFAFGRRRERG